jgi:release factor glutamine methyltransferase
VSDGGVTPLAVARKAADWLAARGIADPRLESELLLAAVLGLKRLDLYLQHERPLGSAELERYRGVVRRRGRREPLQYIVGEAAFRELVLKVDARALIPRPETEVLVGVVLAWAGRRSERLGRPLSAADVGTGTGAIALSLLREGPFSRVVATDISRPALELAAENAAASGHVPELREGAGLGPLAGERFDAIVSNPPYIADAEGAALPPEVREWEPGQALFAGPDGLSVLRELVGDAPGYLMPGGLLALEVGAGQAGDVVAWLGADPRYGAVEVARDLTGRERIVHATAMGEEE